MQHGAVSGSILLRTGEVCPFLSLTIEPQLPLCLCSAEGAQGLLHPKRFEDESKHWEHHRSWQRVGLRMESKRWDQFSVGKRAMDYVTSCHVKYPKVAEAIRTRGQSCECQWEQSGPRRLAPACPIQRGTNPWLQPVPACCPRSLIFAD